MAFLGCVKSIRNYCGTSYCSVNLSAGGRSQTSGQPEQQAVPQVEEEILPEGIVLPAKTIDLGGFELKIGHLQR